MTKQTSTNDKERVEDLISPFDCKMKKMIPHHEKVFENYKLKLKKLITQGYVSELERETVNTMESIRELETFKEELNILRTQIAKTDQEVFDKFIEKHRTSINELIRGYTEHMHIVEEILISGKNDLNKSEISENSDLNKSENSENSDLSMDRFPKTSTEFSEYKDEFMKYDALHDYVDDNFLYEVMKDIDLSFKNWKKSKSLNENLGSSSLSNNDENAVLSVESGNL